MAFDSDYSPVAPYEDEEDRLRDRGYAPAMAAAAPIPAAAPGGGGYAPVYPATPGMGSTQDLEARAARPKTYTGPETTPPTPAPKWSDYAPPEPHGWAKFGHIMAGLTAPTNYAFNIAPEKRAEQRYKNDVAEYERPGKEAEQAASTEQKEAQTEFEREGVKNLQSEEKARENPKPEKPENIQQLYSDAVADAQARGVDPAKDPKVQQLADAVTSLQKQPADKVPPHITVMGPDGKSHIMERDDKTGQYSIDRGVAPPNYAQVLPATLETKTTELLGPDNVMHRYQFNPQTQKYDIDMGAAPTGTAAHQIFQAGAIEQLAPQVIADINANREILGNMSSYYKQWLAGTPVADPKAAQLMTEIMSFAAMQPALHAFRSTNALEAFEKIMGGLSKNPDATIATIKGLLKTPQAFTNMGKGGGKTEDNAKHWNPVKGVYE